MRIGPAIVSLLEQYGVDTVFGIPGTHSIELYRGLVDSHIRHVLPRHEQGAGFMADGYARVTGKPGVCFVITGPGVTNIATPMGQALSDSVPMLVISPVNDSDGTGIHYGRLHEIGDQSAVTAPLTVFSATASNLQEIPLFLHRAFNIFSSKKPGPVHISIPLSLLAADDDVSWTAGMLDPPVLVDTDLIAQAVALINSATAPVIVAGGGCRHFGELVVSLAEKAAIPVITSVAGRGVIAGSHPLSAGAQLSAEAPRELLSASDCVLVIGSELAEPDHWTTGLSLPQQQIWVNLDPVLLSLHADQLTICGDARYVLGDLTRAIEPCDDNGVRAAYARVKPVRDRHGATFTNVQQRHYRVWTELKKSLPADVCIFSDMTQLAYTLIDHVPMAIPNSWMHPNGFGTLGYALPAAIGARIADQQRPILVIVGDAGIQYTLPEMAVAAEHSLNIVVLLWHNDALQQIRDDMVGAGIEPIAVEQGNPDFVELAALYGWDSSRLRGLYELGSTVSAAFSASGPVLLELPESVV